MTSDLKANYKPSYERLANQDGRFDIKALGKERVKQTEKRNIPTIVPGEELEHYYELTKRKLIKVTT